MWITRRPCKTVRRPERPGQSRGHQQRSRVVPAVHEEDVASAGAFRSAAIILADTGRALPVVQYDFAEPSATIIACHAALVRRCRSSQPSRSAFASVAGRARCERRSRQRGVGRAVAAASGERREDAEQNALNSSRCPSVRPRRGSRRSPRAAARAPDARRVPGRPGCRCHGAAPASGVPGSRRPATTRTPRCERTRPRPRRRRSSGRLP